MVVSHPMDHLGGSSTCDASHNRARTRDLGATYTEGPFSYLSAVGRDYVPYRPILHPYHPSGSKFLGGFLGFLVDSPKNSYRF